MRKSLLVLVVAAAMLPGCGKKAEELATEKAMQSMIGGGVDIHGSGDDATIAVKSDDGAMVYGIGASPPMPKDYPQDVLVLEHDKLDSAIAMGATNAIGYQLKGSVADSFGRLKAEMPAQGWQEVLSEQNGDGKSMLIFQKDGRTVQYEFATAADGVATVMQAHSAPE
ncbi:MAG: hypothetical protein KDI32_15035 [Pseudomonadales bacterium]|nr:hypothetical protein [Pseudomonadales bacterium]